MRRLSRPTLVCVAVCSVLLGVAAADYAHVQSRVPPLPADRLEEQFETRAWLYSFAIIAAVAVATAVALRSRRRLGWQRVFTNLGIAGVWSGIAVTVMVVATEGEAAGLPAGAAYAPATAMILAAAVGTVLGRAGGWSDTDAVAEARAGATAVGKWALGGLLSGSHRDAAGRFFSNWSFSFTAATVVLAIVFIQPQPSCGGGELGEPPTWTDTVGAIAGIAAIGAIAGGIGALLLRRWLPALVSLVVNPIALLFMAGSTCAFY